MLRQDQPQLTCAGHCKVPRFFEIPFVQGGHLFDCRHQEKLWGSGGGGGRAGWRMVWREAKDFLPLNTDLKMISAFKLH